jgi:thioredoxin reductase (NADPH)
MEKVLIAGTGPAGLTAALYCARANLAPVVIEGIQPGGQLTTTTEVENYPGFPEGITGPELVQKMREQAEKFGTRYITAEVVSVDYSGKPLKTKLSSGEVIESASVIIATGASARYLGLESEQKLIGRGVSGCATCDGAFYRDEHVAVLGGGDSAIEDAMFLTRFVSSVTMIHRRDELRASKIMADRVKQNDKVKIMWDTVVEEVLGVDENKVTGLKVKNVKTEEESVLPVTGFFVAIGHDPNSVPFKECVDTDEQGFIVAHSSRTNIEGVFAAGDVQDHVYKQAITAAGSGCAAALETERYLEAQGQ